VAASLDLRDRALEFCILVDEAGKQIRAAYRIRAIVALLLLGVLAFRQTRNRADSVNPKLSRRAEEGWKCIRLTLTG